MIQQNPNKTPFYYHLILFAGLFLVFGFWDVSISRIDPSVLFTLPGALFYSTQLLSIFLIYLLNFYFLCPFLLDKKRIFLYFASVPWSLVLFAGVRYFLQEVLVFSLIGIHNYGEESIKPAFYIRDNFFFGLPAIILSVMMFLFWQWQKHLRQNHLLQMENRRARFEMLKSQVSPHFLFNTLNSFYSEWVEKDEAAAEDLLTLSELLRYVITGNEKETVSLREEIEFIQRYIHLQKKRFENRLYLNFSVEGKYNTETLLPAVILHFVENVFKHGLLNAEDKTAVIKIIIKDGFLEIHTANHIQHGENYSSTGIGFDNVEKRLAYAYGTSFTLDKTLENNIFTTYLKLPLNAGT